MKVSSLFLCLCLLFVSVASADTITFTAMVGSYGSSTTTGADGVVATAYYYSSGSWRLSTLFGRNEGTDHGLGICSPGETANCGTGSGGGDYNEISNELHPEAIRITLPHGFTWGSVRLSSLDTNGGTGPVEHGVLFGSNSATMGGPGAIASQICTFAATGAQTCVSTGGVEPTITIPNAFIADQYLYLEAIDLTNPNNTNNDFLLYSVVINRVQPTPEPGSLLLFGSGLLGLGGAVRRKLRR